MRLPHSVNRPSSYQSKAIFLKKSIKTTQKGQALVLGLLLAGLGALAMVRFFSLGQVVGARAKQTHALDAAAYSGALVQTRALNMLAYINRTRVAHQVALGHLVTSGSWASVGGIEERQLLSGNPPAYLITMLFGASHGRAYADSRHAHGFSNLAGFSGDLGQAFQQHDALVHGVLQHAEQAIIDTLPDARFAAMQAVLQENYQNRFDEFQLQIIDDNWPGALRWYSGNSLSPFVQQIAQLYGFLQARNKTAKNPWPVDKRCPTLRHQLRRGGLTQLGTGGIWQSIDTQSLHALRSNRWIGCYYREYPMGWGWIPGQQFQQETAPYVENPPDNFSAQDFWRWVKEATNWDLLSGAHNPLANSRATAARIRWPSAGLPRYLDIDTQKSPIFRFSVRLQHPGPERLTITTESAAESFYQRPHPRSDHKTEASNLFQPYWQARLASSGQALAESLVVILVLLALWQGSTWLGRLQDMALQAQHASRFAAFALTRSQEARPIHSIERHFFSGSAHQWRNADGSLMLPTHADNIRLQVMASQPVGAEAQSGANRAHSSLLRHWWARDDHGIFSASFHVGLVSDGLRLKRFTSLMHGAGHSSDDQQVQKRLAQSETAWQSAYRFSYRSGTQVADVMQKVDGAWPRAQFNPDWLSKWAGFVPQRHLSQ